MSRFERTLIDNSFRKKMKEEVEQIQLSRENIHLNKTTKRNNPARNEFLFIVPWQIIG